MGTIVNSGQLNQEFCITPWPDHNSQVKGLKPHHNTEQNPVASEEKQSLLHVLIEQ